MDRFELQRQVEERLAVVASSIPLAFDWHDNPAAKPTVPPEPFKLDGVVIRLFIVDADPDGRLVWMVRLDQFYTRTDWHAWVRRCDERSGSHGLSAFSSISKDRAEGTYGARLVTLGRETYIIEFDGDVETAAGWLEKHSRDAGFDYRQFLDSKPERVVKGFLGKVIP